MRENYLSGEMVKIIYEIHQKLGCGLFESVYEEAICYLLEKKNIKFERQVEIPVIFDGKELGNGFRADIIVEDKVIIEIKSVEFLHPVHFKQLLTYLKLSNKKLGLLVNFNESDPKDGIRRIVNNL